MLTAAAPAVSLWLAGVMALAVLALQVVPVLAPAMAADTGLPATFVGAWSAGVWAAALLGTLAAPRLLAQASAWRLAQACLLLCMAGIAAVATAHPLGLALGALLVGLGQGLEGPMASHLLAARVAPPKRALWFSVKQAGVQVGAVVASVLLPLLAMRWGWRAAAAVAAAMVLLMTVALAWPARHLGVPRAAVPASPWTGALAVLRQRPTLRWLALAAACFGAVQVVLNGFFVTFAATERGASLTQAGAWLGAAQVGGLVGRLLWGWVAGRLGSILPLLLALGITMAACTAGLGLAGPTWWLLLLFGLSASGWNGIFLAEVAQRVPAAEAGTATAAVLVVMTLGLVGGPLLFSWLGSLLSLATAYVAWAAVALAGCAALAGARVPPGVATSRTPGGQA